MWTRFRRAVVPLVLLLSAIASVIYGARYHYQPVAEEQEIEVTIDPMPFPEGPDDGSMAFPPMGPDDETMPLDDPMGFGPPPELAGVFAPPMMMTQTVIVAEDESEPTLIREVTFGGVVLLATGELMRTYTGQPPSLCPT